MTWPTQRDSVINIVADIRELCPSLDVMGFNVNSPCSASLTSPIISLENIRPPFSVSSVRWIVRRFAGSTLPVMMICTLSCNARASPTSFGRSQCDYRSAVFATMFRFSSNSVASLGLSHCHFQLCCIAGLPSKVIAVRAALG